MLCVYKPVGLMGTQIADSYKNILCKKKVCICGKLDPMAQGQLLLLFDDECKKMEEHLHHEKTYRFKVVWGIQTDSDDTLGLIINEKNINEEDIKVNVIDNYLKDFIGTYEQYFHNYSAKMVHNKYREKHPLWEWTKLGRLDEIEIPLKEVTVKYIKQIDTKKLNMDEIKRDIMENMKYITGNFRQKEINEQWMKYDKKKYIWMTEFEAHVSTGYYIRQFIKDFGKKTGLLGLALDINRISIHI